jgi:hypothetical protein
LQPGPPHGSSGGGGTGTAALVARPDDMAACQIVPGSEWILAKVVEHDSVHGMFKLADEDVESNKSTWMMMHDDADYCDYCHGSCYCERPFH